MELDSANNNKDVQEQIKRNQEDHKAKIQAKDDEIEKLKKQLQE